MFSASIQSLPSRQYRPVAAGLAVLRDPPASYGGGRPRHYDADGGQAITRRAERQVAKRAPAQVEALLGLADRFREDLHGDTRARWLELEEALHGYWLEVSIAHYELGVGNGLRRSVDALLAGLSPRARIAALAQALETIAREMPE